jgi:hypothetical protein
MELAKPGDLVKVVDGSAEVDGLVFDTPSSSNVAVVDPTRGPVFRTVNQSALKERTEEGPGDRALRLLVRRTPPATHDAARGATRSGQRRSGFQRGSAHRPTGR